MNKQAQMSLPSSSLPHKHNFSSCLYLLKGTMFFLSPFFTIRTHLIFRSHSVFARSRHKHPPPSTKCPLMTGLSPVDSLSILCTTVATSIPAQGMPRQAPAGRHGPPHRPGLRHLPAVCIRPNDYATARRLRSCR